MRTIPFFNEAGADQLWRARVITIRETLWELLGVARQSEKPSVEIHSSAPGDGFKLEHISLGDRAGYLFLPDGPGPHPAILYCHWHGGQYEIGKEEMRGTNATPLAPGPEFARRGYAVFGIDAPGFGERNGHGGQHPSGAAGELDAAKWFLWHGQTLWGKTLADDLVALDYLASRPEVDVNRIGVTGISMGSTRAWWLMALDDRLKVGVCLACMTRYQDLIDAKALAAHGIYYYVPGILQHFDSEMIIGAAAPRALLFQTGDQDIGSPIAGVRKIGEAVSRVYTALGHADNFQSIIYPGLGHIYTPEMWDRTLAWFAKHL